MADLNLNPHTFERVMNEETRTYERKLTKVEHYQCLRHQGQPTVYLQNGAVFYESGEEVIDIPEHVKKHIDAMDNDTRKKFGFNARVGRPPSSQSSAGVAA